ncbi:pantoate--beta-alanine ligase [Gelidibacter salicanalis]|uniref:Pantothenate synthetase n=1 Tax=Gelidibacter salicanalis TaxID=291193 RepID=A0A5C7ARZ9_9FLAO|nr:pantoate--beta-alanine ligase [Gelidibacter salicanalis]TXE08632.1 pantoate--beta-alanine ligase [Gelidibacter salicanalis]
MIICHKREELRRVLDGFRLKKQSLGFVPTMGALHQGHLSLINQGLQENAFMVVSIFVNPTQFDNAADLIKYPRTLAHDIELLQSFSERIVVYAPTVEDIYGNTIAAKSFDFDGLEHQMEGKFRKGHFDGVGTVVKRLFEIVQPDYAYFGEKDFQQLRIIQKLVEKHALNVKVIGCDIFRAADGLAMSSRNQRLSEAHRAVAPFIYQILKAAKLRFGMENAKEVTEWVEAQFDMQALLELEYFTIADENTLLPLETKENTKSYRAFIAVFAGEIRLIDNIALN